jgi:branched-chain amino acid transport system permease protein
MSLDVVLLALVDGVSYAGLLFLVALGLTLIFGVLGILNVAHGALYAIGGYLASTLVKWAVSSAGGAPAIVVIAALFVSAIVVGAVLGGVLELGLLRFVQDKDPILQLLITFAAFLILEDVQHLIWGSTPYTASEVVDGLGTVEVFGITYTTYQLIFIPAVALVIYGLLQYSLRYTRVGKQIIAVTHNAEVATALGIHARRIRLVTFVVGAMFGALGGALAAPTTSIVPGVGTDMIVLSFSVVATAGLGQITGALIAALMIGLARSIAVYTYPELEVVVPYLIMVIVLLVRPYGLFTVAQARRI